MNRSFVYYSLGALSGAVTMLITIFLIVITFMWARRFDGLGPNVTVQAVRSIKLGMTEQEVRSILGAPISTGSIPSSYNPITGMLGNFTQLTYVYARNLDSLFYPKLWVYFLEGKVCDIYAKSYVFDDGAIYSLNRFNCDPDDPRRNSDGCAYELPEFVRMFPSERATAD